LLAIPNNVGDLTPLRQAFNLVNNGLYPHILTFFSRRAQGTRVRDALDLTQVIPRAPRPVVTTQEILTVIGTVVQNVMNVDPTYAGPFDGVARGSLPALHDILSLHPPGGGFAGFAQWGDGNHHNPDENVRWHFMKHVLFTDHGEGLDPMGAESLITASLHSSQEETHAVMESLLANDEGEGPATAAEGADWWRALHILLPEAECNDRIKLETDRQRMKPWFVGGNLSHACVEQFLTSGILGRSPRIVGYLVQNYEHLYRTYALNRSGSFSEAFVSSNGVKVFVAGTDGDNFIIARLGAAGALGISSCYRPVDVQDKMRGARLNRMWDLI
jgi:hypothetical protein